MAELRRNQRAEIGRRRVMAHYICSRFSPFLLSSRPSRPRTEHVRYTLKPGPTSPILNEKCHGFLYVPFQLTSKDGGDKARLPPPKQDSLFISSKFEAGAKWTREIIWEGRGLYWNIQKIVSILQKWLELARRAKQERALERGIERGRERERERNPTVGFLSESAEPLWNSAAYLVYSKIFKLTQYALFVLTLRMCLLESYKSVTTTTFSKVWTFSSLRTRPISSSSKTFDRFVLVTVHPPYFSINFTKGSFPRLLMAVVLRQEL